MIWWNVSEIHISIINFMFPIKLYLNSGNMDQKHFWLKQIADKLFG